MNLGVSSSIHYAKKIKEFIVSINDLSRDLRIIVFPDFLSLYSILEVLKNSPVEVGSQDSFWEDKGAFTGEVSPLFLSEIGCKYILLGHPERSINLKEDKQMVNKEYRSEIGNDLRISYGGGVNENNFKNSLDIKELDGIGMGQASLDFNFIK